MSKPIRCFTCGKVLGNKYEKYEKYIDKEQAYIDLGITRYCCKNILMTSIDTYDLFTGYQTFPNTITLKTEKVNIIHNGR
tara:strand:+ start:53 stop:292 length:240 start_codon:yes stop_codon:yes gene_type:complete